jgi:hypothetical protein
MRKKWGRGNLAIPAPIEVNELIRKVPSRKMITITEIRLALAAKHFATIGCPLPLEFSLGSPPNAAEEQKQQGATDITRYWPTLKTGGLLSEKYPGGIEVQKRLLEREICGYSERQKFFVKDYLNTLFFWNFSG